MTTVAGLIVYIAHVTWGLVLSKCSVPFLHLKETSHTRPSDQGAGEQSRIYHTPCRVSVFQENQMKTNMESIFGGKRGSVQGRLCAGSHEAFLWD